MGFDPEDGLGQSDAPRSQVWAGPALPVTPGSRVSTTSVEDASPVLPMPPLRRREPSRATRAAGGERIGRYLVVKEIGAGGMGRVLAAYDPDLDRKVALKILREGVRDGSGGAVRMRREAQAMARLSHPNVAQVYEVADDGGRLFLAMEYIEGTTLRDWLGQRPRSWREVLQVYGEAGRGLAAAHAAGLMHRDFKPETWSPSRTAPLPPTGRILKNRGDLLRSLRRWAARRAAVLATAWQRAERDCSRILRPPGNARVGLPWCRRPLADGRRARGVPEVKQVVVSGWTTWTGGT